MRRERWGWHIFLLISSSYLCSSRTTQNRSVFYVHRPEQGIARPRMRVSCCLPSRTLTGSIRILICNSGNLNCSRKSATWIHPICQDFLNCFQNSKLVKVLSPTSKAKNSLGIKVKIDEGKNGFCRFATSVGCILYFCVTITNKRAAIWDWTLSILHASGKKRSVILEPDSLYFVF